MGDAVKITVIATGFQRDNLPQLARRVGMPETLMPEPAPPPPPAMEPAMSVSFFKEPSLPEPPSMPEETTPQVALDDLEVPAFMRRERRLYQ